MVHLLGSSSLSASAGMIGRPSAMGRRFRGCATLVCRTFLEPYNIVMSSDPKKAPANLGESSAAQNV